MHFLVIHLKAFTLQGDYHANTMTTLLEELKECCVALNRGESVIEKFGAIAVKAEALVHVALHRDKKQTSKVIKISKGFIAERAFNVSREALFLLLERKENVHSWSYSVGLMCKISLDISTGTMRLRNTLTAVELHDYEGSHIFERTVCLTMARLAKQECGIDYVGAAREAARLVYNDGVEWPENLVKYAENYRGPAGHALPAGRQTCFVDAKHQAFDYSISVRGTEVSLLLQIFFPSQYLVSGVINKWHNNILSAEVHTSRG